MPVTQAVTAAPIGHNHPPAEISLEDMLDPDTLREQWAQDHAAVFRRHAELTAALERFSADARAKAAEAKASPDLMVRWGKKERPRWAEFVAVADEEAAKKVTSFGGMLKDGAKLAATTHTAVKAPFLAAGRAADAVFVHEVENVLSQAATAMEFILTAYQDRKAEEERQRLLAEQEAKRLEAERLAKLALATKSADLAEEAIKADEQAEQAEKHAAASLVDLSRTRASSGSTASLREVYVWEVEDITQVPREWLVLDIARVNAAVSRKDNPVRAIPGLKIYPQRTSSIRR